MEGVRTYGYRDAAVRKAGEATPITVSGWTDLLDSAAQASKCPIYPDPQRGPLWTNQREVSYQS